MGEKNAKHSMNAYISRSFDLSWVAYCACAYCGAPPTYKAPPPRPQRRRHLANGPIESSVFWEMLAAGRALFGHSRRLSVAGRVSGRAWSAGTARQTLAAASKPIEPACTLLPSRGFSCLSLHQKTLPWAVIARQYAGMGLGLLLIARKQLETHTPYIIYTS